MTRWTLVLFTSGCVTSGIDLETPPDAGASPDVRLPADRGPLDALVDARVADIGAPRDGAPIPMDAASAADVAPPDVAVPRDGPRDAPPPEPDAPPPEPDMARCIGDEVEVCNGVDDDCDLQVDEEARCALPRASALCEAGACAVVACAAGFFDVNGDPRDGCERGCVGERAVLLGPGVNSKAPRVAVTGARWGVLRATLEGLRLHTDRGAFAVPTPDADYTSLDVAASPTGWLTAVEVLDGVGEVERLELTGLDEGGRVAYTRTTDHASAGRAALTINRALGVAGLAYTTAPAGLWLLFFDLLDPADLHRQRLLERVRVDHGVRPDIVALEDGFGVVVAGVDSVVFVEASARGEPVAHWVLPLRDSPTEVAAAVGPEGVGIHWRLDDGEHGFAVLEREEGAPWLPVFAELQPEVVWREPAVLRTEAGFAAVSLRDTFAESHVEARLFAARGAPETGPVDLVAGRPYRLHARGDRAVWFTGRSDVHTARLDCR